MVSNGRAGEEPTDPDREILARVARGDDSAFAFLVERHQGRLCRLCEGILGNSEDARDAAQEVFLKVFRKAGSFKPKGQVFTWIYRIATNHCLNKLRRRKIVRFVKLEPPETSEAPAWQPEDLAPGPERQLRARGRWRQTRQAIEKLPPGQRGVLVLAKFEGLSYRQIAEVMKITESAVESRLFRAMRNLQRARDEEGAEDS